MTQYFVFLSKLSILSDDILLKASIFKNCPLSIVQGAPFKTQPKKPNLDKASNWYPLYCTQKVLNKYTMLEKVGTGNECPTYSFDLRYMRILLNFIWVKKSHLHRFSKFKTELVKQNFVKSCKNLLNLLLLRNPFVNAYYLLITNETQVLAISITKCFSFLDNKIRLLCSFSNDVLDLINSFQFFFLHLHIATMMA